MLCHFILEDAFGFMSSVSVLCHFILEDAFGFMSSVSVLRCVDFIHSIFVSSHTFRR